MPQLLSEPTLIDIALKCGASNFEEPGAVIPHAGICTGAVG